LTFAETPVLMAAAYCVQCGRPLAPDAQFCASCGTPVPTASSGSGADAPTLDMGATGGSTASPSAPPAGLPLATLLGVQGARSFLVQHLLIGPRHSYRVLDPKKRHLFTIGEDVRQERREMWNNLFHPASGQSGFRVAWGYNSRAELGYWVLEDFAGNARGALELQGTAAEAGATLVDATGTPVAAFRVGRGLTSLEATATTPDGQPILEARGKTFHRNYSLHTATGIEVARIHEPMASVRDTYAVDLVGPVDPVNAIVFAVLVDHFKGR
jgi:zinc-ribbon domain